MILKLAFISKSLLLSISLATVCLLTVCYLFRRAFKPKPTVTAPVSASETKTSSVIESSQLASTALHEPDSSEAPSLSQYTPLQPSTSSPASSHHLDLFIDTSAEMAYAYNFWQFTADCVINTSPDRRQTLKNLRNLDPDNLAILDKWAARDLFNFIPIRTQAQMMYAEDGKLVAQRPEGLPCSNQNNIIPMMCFSQQALCGFIFHLSEKKFYTVDPSHSYHGQDTPGYFCDSDGRNIQADIEEELHILAKTDTIDLSTFTHIERSPKTPLSYTEYAVYKFLCQAMCLALSYDFEDKTLNIAPQDFGMLLANTFANTQESYHSRRITLSHLGGNRLFSSPVASNHEQYEATRKKSEKNDTDRQAPDPRSVNFAASDEFCYYTGLQGGSIAPA